MQLRRTIKVTRRYGDTLNATSNDILVSLGRDIRADDDDEEELHHREDHCSKSTTSKKLLHLQNYLCDPVKVKQDGALFPSLGPNETRESRLRSKHPCSWLIDCLLKKQESMEPEPSEHGTKESSSQDDKQEKRSQHKPRKGKL
jgi:hypothetical protein